MKKLFLISTLIVFGLFNAKAQLQSNLGLRLGGNTEILYQYGFGDASLVEGSLGLGFDKQKDSAFTTTISLTGLYIYSYNFAGSWFVYGGLGGGPEISLNTIKTPSKKLYEIFNLKLALALGIEYQLDAPVSFFLDYRPEMLVKLKGKQIFQFYGLSVGFRYRFE